MKILLVMKLVSFYQLGYETLNVTSQVPFPHSKSVFAKIVPVNIIANIQTNITADNAQDQVLKSINVSH